MTLSKREKKRRDIASRFALSPRNILEYVDMECRKAVKRNQCARSKALKTDPKLLQKVFCVAPPAKEQ